MRGGVEGRSGESKGAEQGGGTGPISTLGSGDSKGGEQGGGEVVAVACGDAHALAATVDGRLWACYVDLAGCGYGALYTWGHDQSGVLGHASAFKKGVPRQVRAPGKDGAAFISIAMGTGYAVEGREAGGRVMRQMRRLGRRR
ncbi:hypothetical protein T484DRAFT_1831760 [Baffinella frigidus]|nr:hypothetical protein T484DRAFT_1831760 [Cryptophyta sp. CCMP2293]